MLSEGSALVNKTCSPVRPTDHFGERFEDSTYKACAGVILEGEDYWLNVIINVEVQRTARA